MSQTENCKFHRSISQNINSLLHRETKVREENYSTTLPSYRPIHTDTTISRRMIFKVPLLYKQKISNANFVEFEKKQISTIQSFRLPTNLSKGNLWQVPKGVQDSRVTIHAFGALSLKRIFTDRTILMNFKRRVIVLQSSLSQPLTCTLSCL